MADVDVMRSSTIDNMNIWVQQDLSLTDHVFYVSKETKSVLLKMVQDIFILIRAYQLGPCLAVL